jgi:hypothetical protein
MVKLYGISTTLGVTMNLFKWNCVETIPEGVMAHDITDECVKTEIKESYQKRFNPEPTPFTHPQQFDPFDPPRGWAYDPYYEFWMKTTD